MDRRRFLLSVPAAAASLHALAQPSSAASSAATLVIHPDKPGPSIPQSFTGFSYEAQQLSDPNFFSGSNRALVDQFRALAPNGVLRIGGNTSDYAFWKPTAQTKAPARPKRPARFGDPSPSLAFPITPQAIENLRDFLDATGWSCIYGLNFGTSTAQLAAEEAGFVAMTLGLKLDYFQIGNEPDRLGATSRDAKTWNADAFFDQWIAFVNAIRAVAPSARFGVPDVASSPEWHASVITRLLAIPRPQRPDIAALTHHYYVGGPPSDPTITLDKILHPDPVVDKLYETISAAAARLGRPERRSVPLRMTEVNTCSGGGKPGVSDVFASALWAADYMLHLASLGYAGVNMHGGEGNMIASAIGVGGSLPGEEMMPDRKAPHPRPFYTPIATIGKDYVLEPVFYGMRFAGALTGGTLLALDFDPGPVNASAYAARLASGHTVVAIINKDATRDLILNEPGWTLEQTLTAPSLTATSGVRFGPAAATATASRVPASSAAILRVG